MNPLVSVVIPSFNHSKYIRDAILSVVHQTYRPIEIVVIDDGSTDNSQEVINKVRDENLDDKDLKWKVVFRENKGAHVTINEGVRISQGEVISILNSDDLYHRDRLAMMVPEITERKAQLVMSLVKGIDENGNALSLYNKRFDWYTRQIHLRHRHPTLSSACLTLPLHVTTGNFVFTKKLFLQIDGFQDLHWVHDYYFLLQACARTEPVLVGKTLIYYRLHSSNTVSSWQTKQALFSREITRCVDDYFSTVIKLKSEDKIINPLAPTPYFWPARFRTATLAQSFSVGQIFSFDQTIQNATSFCNPSTVDRKSTTVDIDKHLQPFFPSKEMQPESMRSFRRQMYLPLDCFKQNPQAILSCKAKPTFKPIVGSEAKLILLDSVFEKRPLGYTKKLAGVAVFLNGRIVSILNYMEGKGRAMSLAGICFEPINRQNRDLLTYAQFDYYRSTYMMRPIEGMNYPSVPENIHPHSDFNSDLHLDKVDRNQVGLVIWGWCQIGGRLPTDIALYIDDQRVYPIIELSPRPDVKHHFKFPNVTQVAGFTLKYTELTGQEKNLEVVCALGNRKISKKVSLKQIMKQFMKSIAKQAVKGSRPEAPTL